MQVSQIKNDLEDLTDTLVDLAETLPTTQAQVSDIRHAYDSGREKVLYITSHGLFPAYLP